MDSNWEVKMIVSEKQEEMVVRFEWKNLNVREMYGDDRIVLTAQEDGGVVFQFLRVDEMS